jgi:hypothetical protein
MLTVKIILFNLGLLAALIFLASGSSASATGMRAARFDPPVPTAPGAVCRYYAAKAERDHRLPRDLLRAIAITESGRWDSAQSATRHGHGHGRLPQELDIGTSAPNKPRLRKSRN